MQSTVVSTLLPPPTHRGTSTASTSRLETDVHFEDSVRLDRHGGKCPTVSLSSSGLVVVVHNSAMGNAMWYWLGRLDVAKRAVDWAPGRHFDYGLYPSVALNDSGVVVEVHRSQWSEELRYRLGRADVHRNIINWGNSEKYGVGADPSVALSSSNVVVAMHMSFEKGQWDLNYMVGKVNISSFSIRWGPLHKFGQGAKPCVAINDSNTVLLVHQSPPLQAHCSVWYCVGYVNDTTIQWGKATEYGNGWCPSASLNAYDQAMIVRQSYRLSKLWYGVGRINPRTKELIEEEGPVSECRDRTLTQSESRFGSGARSLWHPSVSINNQGKVVSVHASNDTKGRALWYQVGTWNEPDHTGEESPPYYYGSDEEEQYLDSPDDYD